MANEILMALARANVVAGIAILLVLALRDPVRRLFGARIAYALWVIVLCSAAAGFLPARSMSGIGDATSHANPPLQLFRAILEPGPNSARKSQMPNFASLLMALWIAGAAGSAGVLTMRQMRFRRMLGRLRPALSVKDVYLSESVSHSPLVTGVLSPKIILPADFALKFSDEESVLVLAHERVHVNYGDMQINLLVAILRCLNWFNPLIHFAAFQIRLDQEIACDADVMAIYPEKRRSYAEAMLKNILSLTDVPVGCSWPSRSARPLKKRIALLNRLAPNRAIRLAGVSIVAIAGIAGAYASWAAQPSTNEIAEGALQVKSSAPTATFREMIWGDPQAKVIMMEYASLTCPHCAFFSNDVFPRIKKAYIDSGKIRFVYRDYPIDNLAMGGALISRCAPEDSGKKLVELMFRNLHEWQGSQEPLDTLKQYAAQAGMDPGDVDACLQNQTLLGALQDEQKTAATLYQVKATPTFLIGDEKYEGVPNDPDRAYAALSEIIERQLKKAK